MSLRKKKYEDITAFGKEEKTDEVAKKKKVNKSGKVFRRMNVLGRGKETKTKTQRKAK